MYTCLENDNLLFLTKGFFGCSKWGFHWLQMTSAVLRLLLATCAKASEYWDCWRRALSRFCFREDPLLRSVGKGLGCAAECETVPADQNPIGFVFPTTLGKRSLSPISSRLNALEAITSPNSTISPCLCHSPCSKRNPSTSRLLCFGFWRKHVSVQKHSKASCALVLACSSCWFSPKKSGREATADSGVFSWSSGKLPASCFAIYINALT